MTESQLIAGTWALPTVESNVGGTVRMHVSVSVPEVGSMSDTPIDVQMSAGGVPLEVSEPASTDRYYYLETLSVTLVADVAFANPQGLTPDTVTISFGGESATFAVTVREPDEGPPIV
jgi:hypothetical protein